MVLEYPWTERDFIAAQFLWLRRNPLQLLKGLWYPLVVCALAIWVVVTDPSRWKNALVALAAAAAITALGVIIALWRWHRIFQKSQISSGALQAVLDDHGVLIKSPGMEVRTRWDFIGSYYESSRLFVLETKKREPIYIPKATLSVMEIDRLR